MRTALQSFGREDSSAVCPGGAEGRRRRPARCAAPRAAAPGGSWGRAHSSLDTLVRRTVSWVDHQPSRNIHAGAHNPSQTAAAVRPTGPPGSPGLNAAPVRRQRGGQGSPCLARGQPALPSPRGSPYSPNQGCVPGQPANAPKLPPRLWARAHRRRRQSPTAWQPPEPRAPNFRPQTSRSSTCRPKCGSASRTARRTQPCLTSP